MRGRTPIFVDVPIPPILDPLVIAATVSFILSFLVFHYDLLLVTRDMNIFKRARTAYFAHLIKFTQRTPLIANSVFWTGDVEEVDVRGSSMSRNQSKATQKPIFSLAYSLRTTGRGLMELLQEDSIPNDLDEISTIVAALISFCEANSVKVKPPPVFQYSQRQTKLNYAVCILFTLTTAILFTAASRLIEIEIEESKGTILLGLGGATLHIVNFITWVIFLLQAKCAYDAFQYMKQRQNAIGEVEFSMGDLEKMRNSQIFPIAVYSFMIVMHVSIYMLCKLEGMSFRWAEQWYYSTVSGIGFVLRDADSYMGKVYTQTIGVYGFLHLFLILTIGAGLLLDRLHIRMEVIVSRLNTQTMKVERRSVVGRVSSKLTKLRSNWMPWIATNPITVVTVLIFLLWASGTIGFAFFEGWDYNDASFFSVNVLLTEGYSIVYPNTSMGRIFLYYYILATAGIWACGLGIVFDKLQNSHVQIVKRPPMQRMSELVQSQRDSNLSLNRL
ncbi:hypothetical protein HDU79_010472 [Rhizoclosmatium sp. JEL0117]|nr:hypothetical protein HDU79_010472 [Rhizoclosmatium sp. JEL0117]